MSEEAIKQKVSSISKRTSRKIEEPQDQRCWIFKEMERVRLVCESLLGKQYTVTLKAQDGAVYCT